MPMSDEAVISTLQTELIKRDDSDDKSKLQYLVDTDNKPNDDDGFLMMMMLKFKKRRYMEYIKCCTERENELDLTRLLE